MLQVDGVAAKGSLWTLMDYSALLPSSVSLGCQLTATRLLALPSLTQGGCGLFLLPVTLHCLCQCSFVPLVWNVVTFSVLANVGTGLEAKYLYGNLISRNAVLSYVL